MESLVEPPEVGGTAAFLVTASCALEVLRMLWMVQGGAYATLVKHDRKKQLENDGYIANMGWL